ncbi:diguanylate cyclase (GGDEF) domain-containing protein [Desulfurobacterium pacificum]|uniref:Diguanylate cyclase (GGDEF) domain-containing protein n=1 Tax=Desulfurobacterium pacificum TaxID=240166 RepID=A0ABY1NWI0_9BACT|nr:diguanylate cyclase (GGDEF) domain-containing protein [Desulfurobacterium pacificum]
MNPLFPQLEGKNLWNWKDLHGKFVHREFENVVLYSPNHEGFVTYYWYLPGTKKVDEKIAFVKLFKPYNWIIGGGFYLSDYRDYVKRILLGEGRLSSVFVIDCSSPAKAMSSKFWKVIDCTNSDVYREGVFVTDDKNIYYIKYFPRWNWFVGSYVSKDALVQEVAALKEDIFPKINSLLVFSSLVVLVVFGGALLGLGYLFGELYKTLKKVTETNEKLKKLSREMYLRAYTDDLTGLPNRKKLLEDILSKECSEKVFFALINIRNFREVNDLFGLEEGDGILKKFALTLNSMVKEIDPSMKVYRVRGDKFGVLKCGSDANEEEFISIIKELIRNLEESEFEVGEVKFKLDVVAGVSKNRDNLIIESEIAEQEAKKRNMDIYVFDSELEEIFKEMHKNIIIATELKEAIVEDRIIPVFQPIIDLRSDNVDKYEVLMRIKDKEGNFISPGDFLPVAKKISLYSKLSRRLIEKAIDVVKRKGIKVSINISSEDLASSENRRWLLEIIEDEDIAKNVCFEIVETEAFSDLNILKNFYSEIKERGSELAIDDFGSGYSNYEYISIIKPDYLKVDGSLISKILESEDVETLVKYIVKFAQDLKIKTVAEFVSSEEIYKKVIELGFDYGQGFYLGKPVTEDEL